MPRSKRGSTQAGVRWNTVRCAHPGLDLGNELDGGGAGSEDGYSLAGHVVAAKAAKPDRFRFTRDMFVTRG
jgi:hypothetical protein